MKSDFNCMAKELGLKMKGKIIIVGRVEVMVLHPKY